MNNSKRDRLIQLLRNPSPEMRAHLHKSKADGLRGGQRSDFVWHYLLQSFSTMGNSRGWKGLIDNKANYRRVTFNALSKLSWRARRRVVEDTLRRAAVRRPVKKAEWLCRNFDRVKELGGLKAARNAAMAERGTAAKIAFMKQFDGIGEKYGRNIWMDIYHSEFRTTIAVDERIKNISKELGASFSNYSEHEAFYQALATECGLEPWELDRLLLAGRDGFNSCRWQGTRLESIAAATNIAAPGCKRNPSGFFARQRSARRMKHYHRVHAAANCSHTVCRDPIRA